MKNNDYNLMQYANENVIMSKFNQNSTILEFLIKEKNITPKVSSHSFRHSISRYLLIDKGLPISKVKDYLRHTNIETTSKYLENTDEETQELRKSIVF